MGEALPSHGDMSIPMRPHLRIALNSISGFILWIKGASWLIMGLSSDDTGAVQALLTERAAATAVSVGSGMSSLQTVWQHGPSASLGLGVFAYVALWAPKLTVQKGIKPGKKNREK